MVAWYLRLYGIMCDIVLLLTGNLRFAANVFECTKLSNNSKMSDVFELSIFIENCVISYKGIGYEGKKRYVNIIHI